MSNKLTCDSHCEWKSESLQGSLEGEFEEIKSMRRCHMRQQCFQYMFLLLGGRFDWTLAWAGGSSGDIYHHDLEQSSYYHDQLLDHGDHDHEGGVGGAPGGDQQGPSMVNTMSG